MNVDRGKPINKMVSCEKRHPCARMSSRGKHDVTIGFPDWEMAATCPQKRENIQ